MQFATMLMLAGIGIGIGLGFGCCTLADAAGQAAESGPGGWTEAQSLRELPAGIQALLGVGLGADGIADRGEDFNEGDVRADNMPGRRFALGIVNGTTAIVAVERGGRAYSVSAVEFRQAGTTWDAVRCAALTEPPRHGTDLADALAGRHGIHPGPCGDFGMRIAPAIGGAPAGMSAVSAPSATAPVLPARVRLRPGA